MTNSQVRNLIMLSVLAVWMLYALVAILRHEEIAALTWGIPGVVYGALYGPSMLGKKGPEPDSVEPKPKPRRRPVKDASGGEVE